MERYVEESGANYFVGSFQWGNLTHVEASHSLDLFRKRWTAEPKDLWAGSDVAITLAKSGALSLAAGDGGEALRRYGEALRGKSQKRWCR